jgi:hypothetical protein
VKGDALLAHLSIDPRVIDRHALDREVAARGLEQTRLELALAELARRLPVEAGLVSSA